MRQAGRGVRRRSGCRVVGCGVACGLFFRKQRPLVAEGLDVKELEPKEVEPKEKEVEQEQTEQEQTEQEQTEQEQTEQAESEKTEGKVMTKGKK